MNLVPNKQLLLFVTCQTTTYRKKELCVDNKVQETNGYLFCPTCRNKKGVYISTKNTISFYDCKKCKPCCHDLNIPFKDQIPKHSLFGGDGTHCFARKMNRGNEKKPSPFMKKILPQSQASTSEPEQKTQNFFHLWHNRVDTPLVGTVNQNFIYVLFLYTFSLH